MDLYAALGDAGSFPGSCDETLSRPDVAKSELMDFAIHRFPGKTKFDLLERGVRNGLLQHLPEMDHWAMEEFAWHGTPGDSWQPVDEYLRLPGLPYSAAARAQICLWKQARIGLFEIGAIVGDTIWLHEWDVVHQRPIGEPFRAITLNLGGVHALAQGRGRLLLTHVSPWDLDQKIYCGMGYGRVLPKDQALLLHEYLGLRHLEVVSRTLPWLNGRDAEKKYLREWRQREWQGWFADRVQFPFEAMAPTSADGILKVVRIFEMVASTPAEAGRMGIYFHGKVDTGTHLVLGGTSVTALDVASANRMAFAEYQAYRAIVGPPSGTRGQPTFLEFSPQR